jgi:F-type H+-transporting ATPase subunit epsilon
MKELNLEVITPAKSVYSGKIKSITVPGTSGNFQVLYNHAPILSSIEIGIITIEDIEGIKTEYATSGGTIEVINNKILLLVETFEKPENIDADRATKSAERAKERLTKKREEEIDMARAELSLKRAINRLKVKTRI